MTSSTRTWTDGYVTSALSYAQVVRGWIPLQDGTTVLEDGAGRVVARLRPGQLAWIGERVSPAGEVSAPVVEDSDYLAVVHATTAAVDNGDPCEWGAIDPELALRAASVEDRIRRQAAAGAWHVEADRRLRAPVGHQVPIAGRWRRASGAISQAFGYWLETHPRFPSGACPMWARQAWDDCDYAWREAIMAPEIRPVP